MYNQPSVSQEDARNPFGDPTQTITVRILFIYNSLIRIINLYNLFKIISTIPFKTLSSVILIKFPQFKIKRIKTLI